MLSNSVGKEMPVYIFLFYTVGQHFDLANLDLKHLGKNAVERCKICNYSSKSLPPYQDVINPTIWPKVLH